MAVPEHSDVRWAEKVIALEAEVERLRDIIDRASRMCEQDDAAMVQQILQECRHA